MKTFFSTLLASFLVAAAAAHAHEMQHAHERQSDETFAAGVLGDPRDGARTVDVTIREHSNGTMSFATGQLAATRGEQVRFVIRNDGGTPHEFRLDTVAGNAAHKAMMARMPGMVHRDGNAVEIAPGARAVLVWRFSKPGIYEYACLVPGHYEAGMHGEIVVAE